MIIIRCTNCKTADNEIKMTPTQKWDLIQKVRRKTRKCICGREVFSFHDNDLVCIKCDFNGMN